VAGVGRIGAICGPLIGGWLLGRGIAYPWGFYVFAAVGALGAIAIALVDADPAPDEPLPAAEPAGGDGHAARTDRR
jgi:MFS family permease